MSCVISGFDAAAFEMRIGQRQGWQYSFPDLQRSHVSSAGCPEERIIVPCPHAQHQAEAEGLGGQETRLSHLHWQEAASTAFEQMPCHVLQMAWEMRQATVPQDAGAPR